MTRDLVLTVDVGTGSSRAFVYSISEAKILSFSSYHAQIDHPDQHRAEFSPESWKKTAVEAMREAVNLAKARPEDYLGITATCLRQGFVLLDATGVPIGPGVLNYDRRGAQGIPIIEKKISIDDLYTLTGHWHAPELTLPKLVYLKEYEPEIWNKVSTLLFLHDWILYELSGEVCSTSTMICAGQMANLQERTWAFDLLTELGFEKKILPPLLECGSLIGGLQEAIAAQIGLLAGTPIIVGGGDTQFGSLGAGGMKPGTVVIVGGSTTPLLLTSTTPILDEKRYPWVSTHLGRELWSVEMNAGQTGMIYTWFLNTFGSAQVKLAESKDMDAYEVLNELAMASSLGTNGVRAIASSPRWAQDTWEKKAPFVFIGFTSADTLGVFARSILEAVCYAVRGNLEQLERVMGSGAEKTIYTGGTARPAFWAQMMADVLGRPIFVPDMKDSAALAGAQVVLWGVGDRSNIAPPKYREYLPDADATAAYQPHYRDYVEKFEALQSTLSENSS